jgi:hypothetical protein
METEGSLLRLQKPATYHHSEHCCMTAARNGRIFHFQAIRTKPNVTFHDMESQAVTNISEYRAAAMYSDTELQVLTKQLKNPNKLQYNT